jgi:hypothetical protein
MKCFTRKLVGRVGRALIVFLLAIGFTVGTNIIQPDLVAKAAASVGSHQQTSQDQSTNNIQGLTIAFVNQETSPHSESNLSQSEPGDHHMPTSPGSTMPAMPTPGTDMPGMDHRHNDHNSSTGMPDMNVPSTDHGHSGHNPSTGIPFDMKIPVLSAFAVFNGLVLIIAAFLKRHLSQRKRTNTHKKTGQHSHPKESVV